MPNMSMVFLTIDNFYGYGYTLINRHIIMNLVNA